MPVDATALEPPTTPSSLLGGDGSKPETSRRCGDLLSHLLVTDTQRMRMSIDCSVHVKRRSACTGADAHHRADLDAAQARQGTRVGTAPIRPLPAAPVFLSCGERAPRLAAPAAESTAHHAAAVSQCRALQISVAGFA